MNSWEDVPAALCSLSPAGSVTSANSACALLLKSPGGELRGRNFLEFFPGDLRPGLRNLWMSLSPEEPVGSWSASGAGAFPQDWAFKAFFDDDGNLLSLNGAGREVIAQCRGPESSGPCDKKYSMLLENSPDLIYLMDVRDERYVYISPSVRGIFGYTPDEALRLKPADVLTPESYALQREGLLRAVSSDTARAEVLRLEAVRKDGSVFPVEVHAFLIFSPGGKPDRVAGILRDISPYEKDREMFLEGKKELEMFFSQSFSGFFFMMLDEPLDWENSPDKDGALDRVFSTQRMTKANRAMLEQYGASEKDFLGLTPGQLFAHDIEEGRRIWRGLFDAGRTRVEINARRLDGQPFIIGGDYICLYDEEGRITGHFGIQADITRRRWAEEDLRESEQKFKDFFQASGDGIVRIDREGNVTEANSAFISLLGFESLEEVKLNYPDILRPFACGSREENMPDSLVEADFSYEYSMELSRRDGSVIYVGVKIRDSLAERDKGARWIILRDITAEKQAIGKERLMNDVLFAVNQSGGVEETAGEALKKIKTCSGADAAAIRLRSGRDFPYACSEGFSQDFILAENFLSLCGEGLECTCGLVLSGKADPSNPLFTPGGSAWTNDSASLLRIPEKDDPRTNPRNRCIREGYRSIALVPIRSGSDVIGLLQLNFRAPGQLNEDYMCFLERLGDALGMALHRKEMEEKLAAKERESRAILDVMPDIIIRLDKYGSYIDVKASSEKKLAAPAEELKGKNLKDFFPPETAALIMSVVKSAVDSGSLQSIEYELEVPEGRLMFESRIMSMGGEEAVCFIRDITERKKAEEEISFRNSFLEMVSDLSSEFITADASSFGGTIDRMLGRMGEFFGVDRAYYFRLDSDSGTMRNTSEWCAAGITPHKDDNAFSVSSFPWAMGKLEEGGLVHVPDVESFGDDAGPEKTEWSRQGIKSMLCLPVRAGGRLAGFFGFDSVREKREWSDDRVHLLRILAGVLSDAESKILWEGEMEAAVKRAEEASRSKSAFLANMSHEIRTPMNGVIGMTDLLLGTELDVRQRGYAEIVKTSGELLMGIVNDIIDISKIEAGKVSVQRKEFSLRRMVEEFTAMMGVRAEEKGLEFLGSVDEGAPDYFEGDEGHIRQVLFNLAGNAVKFTGEGRVELKAGMEREEGDEAVLAFSVKDTGIGIPADKGGLIFEKFGQADDSTAGRYGGTGLGLAISKELVELMGGEIGFRSSEGEGSEFWFTVKVKKLSPPAEKAPESLRRGARVLLVDDSEANRRMLSGRLSSWGLETEEASGGDEALLKVSRAAAEGEPFSAAIIDGRMPGIDGITLARRIRGREGLQTLRLILSSSLAHGEGDIPPGVFSSVVPKPVSFVDLREALGEIIPGSAGDEPESGKAPRAGARVLVVEDDAVNLQVAEGLLGKFGMVVESAGSAEEALEMLSGASYESVFMDVSLPGMDGMEAARVIRSSGQESVNRDVPIIAMTAYAMAEDREKCLSAGMDDYVAKPLDSGAVERVLLKWLPGGGPEVFNLEDVRNRLKLDDELLDGIFKKFLEDAPGRLELLEKSLAEGDAAAAKRHAHTLKGASGNVGGGSMSEAALEIENALEEGGLAKAGVLLPALRREFEKLKNAMQSGRSDARVEEGGFA